LQVRLFEKLNDCSNAGLKGIQISVSSKFFKDRLGERMVLDYARTKEENQARLCALPPLASWFSY
jgi:hypothetical protein